MTSPYPSAKTARRMTSRGAATIAKTIALALAFAPSIAHASYTDGAWGFIVCLFLVPAALLALLVASILRAAGMFEKPALALCFRWIIGIAAIVPAVTVLSANDTVSTVMVLAVDGLALVAIFWLTRAPKSAKPQTDVTETIGE